MKFAIIVILSCLYVCYANHHSFTITTLGDVNTRSFAKKDVIVEPSLFEIKNATFRFPSVRIRFFKASSVAWLWFPSLALVP